MEFPQIQRYSGKTMELVGKIQGKKQNKWYQPYTFCDHW
jgi:hypothetical protein